VAYMERPAVAVNHPVEGALGKAAFAVLSRTLEHGQSEILGLFTLPLFFCIPLVLLDLAAENCRAEFLEGMPDGLVGGSPNGIAE